uniref:Dehydrogenase n=1 Tax=Rhodnius prolixus TaxID=13249 RepID=T1HSR3_RHOPR
MDKWCDKVALVTGGNSGIGLATVELLLDRHLKVIAIDKYLDKLETLQKDDQNIEKGKSKKLFPIKADLCKEEEVTKAFQWIENNLGEINLLVNNAGMGGITSLLEEWKLMLGVNVVAFGLCITETVKLMRKTKTSNGIIINITSNLSHFVPDYPPFHFYSATKHAAKALVEGFRQEFLSLEIPIRITSVSPGFVKTGIIRSSLGKNVEKHLYENYPSICPQEIASAIEYILSTPPDVTIREIAIGPTGSKN